MKVFFELSNLQFPHEKFHLQMDVFDNSLGRKWFQLLKKTLREEECSLEKNYSFLGFPNTIRDLPTLCQLMNQYIGEINNSGHYPRLIAQHFSAEQLLTQPAIARDILNDLHHHFELLQGQEWDLSPFFTTASPSLKYAFRQINQLCHEIENLLKTIELSIDNPDLCSPATLIALLREQDLRYDLSAEDYNYFRWKLSFGDVFLSYCQSGKTHLEAFNDQDTAIDRKNISGLLYYTPECVIHWGPDKQDLSVVEDWEHDFRRWLIKHDYNPEEKTLGLGFAVIGRISPEQFPFKNLKDIHQFLGDHANITKITTLDLDHALVLTLDNEKNSEEITSKSFPEFWTDTDYIQKQIALLYEDD